MIRKLNRVDLKINEKTHWKGSHTNQHVRNQYLKLKTKDSSIVSVSFMACY